MKLVGYIRVSTDAQRENTSLPEQLKQLRNYCRAFGHELVEVFQDVGSGADTEKRPQFHACLEALKNADGIIACKLDRLARNTRQVLTLVEDHLDPFSKALVVIDLNIDTSSPLGRMILTVIAAVAALERDLIRERTQSGRRAKSESGGYAYGAPRFGCAAENRELVEVQVEKEAIRFICDLRRQGHTYQEIAQALISDGVKTKRGGRWDKRQIKTIYDRSREDAG